MDWEHITQEWWGSPLRLIAIVWIAWAVSWLLAAAWSRRTAARPGLGAEAPNRVVTLVGALMLAGYIRFGENLAHWWLPDAWQWICLLAVCAGVAFTWWARLHLGSLWSSTVTAKDAHRIIDTGPYALVRHPIYTGLIFSLLATGVAFGAISHLAGAVLMAIGFWMKARLEEKFLSAQLGEAGYAEYRARVPMLLPFAPPASGL